MGAFRAIARDSFAKGEVAKVLKRVTFKYTGQKGVAFADGTLELHGDLGNLSTGRVTESEVKTFLMKSL